MAKQEAKEPKAETSKAKVKTIEDYYSIGKWKGFDQFKCKLCNFDSLEEKEIKKHIIEQHMPKPIKPKVETQLLDRYGNKI